MSLKALKIVAHGATKSAHAEEGECFHCIALEALKGIAALEAAAVALAPFATHNPRTDSERSLELLSTIAKEAPPDVGGALERLNEGEE